jgi:Xaa-Pro aminopeptidase
MSTHAPSGDLQPPFDAAYLDQLLQDNGIDVLMVTSKHNIQHLLGGYHYFFHKAGDAIGISRYLPILVYPVGRPDKAAYFGNAMEAFENENGRFWTPIVSTRSWGTLDAMALASSYLSELGLPVARIGVELAFLPADAFHHLTAAMPDSRIVDAHLPLERLRACKSVAELELVEYASRAVVDAMLATFKRTVPGMSKREIANILLHEEVRRDLDFEYCLISAGTTLNRAPSDYRVRPGDIMSLDSGGRHKGFIGDLCRMGIVDASPDQELEDLLAEVEDVQQVARRPIKAGATGAEIFAAAEAVLRRSKVRSHIDFMAHGVGIIGHEAPRLTSHSPLHYQGIDEHLPLKTGMVLSIETTMAHPRRGLIKLEDTLAVTENGFEAYGDNGRGWNVAGASLP